MSQYDPKFDIKINVGHFLRIFHGQVILPFILKTIRCMNIIIWDYESVWPEVYLKINIGHYDLHFMVQWFYVISWRLFDVYTLGLWVVSMTQRLTSK